MGKGSRVRDERMQNGNDTATVKLSKKQIIKLQEKKKRNKKIITWSITAVVAIAVVVAIILTSIPKVPNLEKHLVADNELIEIDGAMFAYVVYDYVGQYGSYMSQQGYNPNLGLLNQTTQYTSGNSSMTWYKYFCGLAESKLNEYVSFASAQLAAAAEKKGSAVTIDEVLTKEDKDQINDYMKDLKEHALSSGYGGVNKFLSAVYAPGVTEGALRRYLKIEALAYAYVEDYLDSLTYTDEQLTEYRDDNPDSFKKIDYVYYTFTETYAKDATTEQKQEAYAKAKAAAEAFVAEHKTVESFKDGIYELEKAKKEASTTTGATTTAATTGNTEEDIAAEKESLVKKYTSTGVLYNTTKAEAADTKAYYEWAYSTDRVANDTYVQEVKASNGDLSYTVYIIEKGVYIDEYDSQSVRHILFDIDTSLKGTVLEKAYEAAKKEAEKVLEEYNKGDKTAEKFGELAKEHTADSNGEDGGLYENVLKGQMVTEFEDWIYSADRTEGETGLVKTEYGYHLMYYVGKGKTAWKVTAESGLKNEDYEKHLEELNEKYELEYDYEAMFISLGGEM
ncbi:MAG: peptidyl-prolyl cis-trans isomerase [Clostridia bacterium]|nr:peptidyl-prolyl cis-trans isomerase [Clostridia bacterium]